MQEDKEGLFDALDTVKHTLATFAAMLGTLKPLPERMRQAASDSFLMATDLAEWLVRQGLPFRDADHQVGRFVAACIGRGQNLAQASLEQMRECIPLATQECLQLWQAQKSVEARDLPGGTAPAQVQKRLEFRKEKLGL